MNRFVAAVALVCIATPAFAANEIQVSRSTFLDEFGAAPQSLRSTVNATVSVSGSIAPYQCTLAWTSGTPSAQQLALPAPGDQVPSNTGFGTTSGFSSLTGVVTLTYQGKLNKTSKSDPNGMALGDAFYEGGFTAVSGYTDGIVLGCPSGGSVTLGFVPDTYNPGQPYIAPTPGTLEVRELDPVCKAARKAAVDALGGPNAVAGGYAYGQYCDEIVTTPAVAGSPGQEYIAPSGDHGNPGTAFSYSYTAPSLAGLTTITGYTVLGLN